MNKIITRVFAGSLYFLVATACTKESNQLSSSALSQSEEKSNHYIGEHFGGGIIFYINASGRHGLIAAAEDIEEPSVWAYHDTVTGANATWIGAGYRNTLKIVRVQGDPGDQTEDYAALECAEFTDTGYKFWYLPSKGELNELYKQKDKVGGFKPFAYWSSSEFDLTTAWFQNFSSGLQVKEVKTASYSIRPVRYF